MVFFDETISEKIKDSLNCIQSIFQNYVGSEQVEDISLRTWRGHMMAIASNRYFTPQSLVAHESLTSFKDGVDPKQLLIRHAIAAKEDYVNLDENRVRYFENLVDER